MKTILSLASLMVAAQLYAQTAQTTTFPGGSRGLPASPANSGLPGSPANNGLPGFDNSFAPFFTNQSSTNIIGGNLNQLLVNLQINLSQLLPLLAAANNGYDISSALGTNGLSSITNGLGTTPTTSQPNNLSANLSTSLGQDLSSIVGGRANTLRPGTTALGGGTTALTPATPLSTSTALNGANGFTNSLGLQSGFGFSANNLLTTRDVLRALLILQSDIERMLPEVNALNGGSAATLGLVYTNGVQTTTGVVNANSRNAFGLTPTGR